MQKFRRGLLRPVIITISFFLCQYICPADNNCPESQCKESRLGDLLVRASHGNKEFPSIGSYTIVLYRVLNLNFHDVIKELKDGTVEKDLILQLHQGEESESENFDFITGLVRPRDGTVVEVWITQLDKGKDPEIIVWTRCAGSGAYGEIDLFRFTGGSLVQLESPEEIKLKGYSGHDIFEIKYGKLFRSFPLYKESDPNCSPTGGTAEMVLDFKDMKWKPIKKEGIQDVQ